MIQYQLNQKHEKNLLYMVLFIGGFNPSIRVYMNAVRFVKEILHAYYNKKQDVRICVSQWAVIF